MIILMAYYPNKFDIRFQNDVFTANAIWNRLKWPQ